MAQCHDGSVPSGSHTRDGHKTPTEPVVHVINHTCCSCRIHIRLNNCCKKKRCIKDRIDAKWGLSGSRLAFILLSLTLFVKMIKSHRVQRAVESIQVQVMLTTRTNTLAGQLAIYTLKRTKAWGSYSCADVEAPPE